MNIKTKNRLLPIFFSLMFLTGIGTWLIYAAGSIKLYVAPASKSIVNSETFNVDVRVDTAGSSINYVRAYLNFPADKLVVTSLSSAGSSFDHQFEQTNNGSQIRLTRYSTSGPLSGDLLVGTVTFKNIAPGSATVNFDSTSLAYNTSGGSGQPPLTTQGGTYTVVAPAPPPAPKPSQSSPSPQLHSQSPSSLPKAISPSSSQPAPNSSPETPAALPADGSLSYTYPVEIIILKSPKKPASGAVVRIGSVTQQADNSGKTIFNLPAGESSVQVTYAKTTKNFTVKVEAKATITDADSDIQRFSLVLTSAGPGWLNAIKFLGIVILLAAFGFGLFLMLKGRFSRKIAIKSRQESAISPNLIKPGETLATRTTPTVAAVPVAIPPQTIKPKPMVPVADTHPATHKPVPAKSLHPHSVAHTVKPVKKAKSPIAPAKPAPQPKTSPPPVISRKGITQTPIQHPAPAAASSPSHTPIPAPVTGAPKPAGRIDKPSNPLAAVEPYKSTGEPKDIFEMAEERFEQDERFKSLRKQDP